MASQAQLSTDQAQSLEPRRPSAFTDWLMLVLAMVSVGLLSWITFWEVPQTIEDRVIVADYVVCGIFFLEFVWRWRRSREGWRFPLKYWYEVLGMIPVSHPAFRSFRLIRIVIVLARLGRAIDRVYGDRVTAAVVARFSDTIVSVIRRPVTVAVLDEVVTVLAAGAHARNVAIALERNRDELDAMIVELVRKDRTIGAMRLLPFHKDLIRLVTDTVFRILFEALHDERTHRMIADVINEEAGQMRESVATGETYAEHFR